MPLKQKLASVYKKIMKITLFRKLNKIEYTVQNLNFSTEMIIWYSVIFDIFFTWMHCFTKYLSD